MLNPSHIRLVRDTWAAIGSEDDVLCFLFLEEVSRREPMLRWRFHPDQGLAGAAVFRAMDEVLRALDSESELLAFLEKTGQAHAYHGFWRGDLTTLAQAWVAALQTRLGPELTKARQVAWTQLWQTVSGPLEKALFAKARGPVPV